jgi:sugar diacid utilization regulator
VAGVANERGLLVVAVGDDAEAGRQGDVVLSAARQVADADQMALSVGVGLAVGQIEELPVSFEQAAHAVRMARKRGAGHLSVTWASLGADRMIIALLGDRDPASFVPSSVRRLLDALGGAVLVETLQVYLDLAGDAQAVAQGLCVHRSTLYHRLHRIEEITDCDLRRGDDRLELHMGLRLARLLAAPAEAASQVG